MTNLLASCLVLTSLAAAGVWTPTPEKQKQGEDVIVKEGHRTVVVEYERDGQPNTIVSISPEQHRAPYKPEFSTQAEGGIPSSASGMVEKAKEKIKEASSSLPNLGQGVSQSSEESERESHASPKELICDALGKCKHKIASAMGKTKEIVSETAQEAIDRTKEKAHEAEEEAKQTAREVISKPKEKAQEVGDAAAHAFGKAKETLSRKAQEVEEYAKVSVEDAMGKVKEAKDTGKKIGEHIATNLSEKMEMAKDQEVAEKTKGAKETAERAAEKLKKQSKMGMSGILERGRDVGHDAVKYVKSLEAMRSLMFVLNLLGLATAYGMCVWVTFISSYILAAAMPRHQFGIVQSKVYPVYFSAMAASIGATLVGLVLGNTRRPVQLRKAEILQAYFPMSSLLMVLVNMLYLEPRATKVMFERIKVEKEEGRGREELTAEPSRASEPKPDAEPAASITTSALTAAPAEPPLGGAEQEVIRIRIVGLNDRLKKLNTYSSLLNILTLMTLSWHLVYLSKRLHLMC